MEWKQKGGRGKGGEGIKQCSLLFLSLGEMFKNGHNYKTKFPRKLLSPPVHCYLCFLKFLQKSKCVGSNIVVENYIRNNNWKTYTDKEDRYQQSNTFISMHISSNWNKLTPPPHYFKVEWTKQKSELSNITYILYYNAGLLFNQSRKLSHHLTYVIITEL